MSHYPLDVYKGGMEPQEGEKEMPEMAKWLVCHLLSLT
jgi:hypothetical protein